MIETITLLKADGETSDDVTMLANGATSIYYKQIFGEDLIRMMSRSASDLSNLDGNFVNKLAFIMAMNARHEDMKKLSFDNFVDWIAEYDSGCLIEKQNEIVGVYLSTKKTGSKAKKKAGQ